MYYKKHIFFCTNVKGAGRKCCSNFDSVSMFEYTREKLKDMGVKVGPDGVRVSKSGCLGRCSLGPTMVIYPDNVWYTYSDTSDIDIILENHIVAGEVVKQLEL